MLFHLKSFSCCILKFWEMLQPLWQQRAHTSVCATEEWSRNVERKITYTTNTSSSTSYHSCLLLVISLLIEVREQKVEHHCMKTNPPHKRPGIVAVNEKQLEGMNHHKHKLNLKEIHSLIKLLCYKSLNSLTCFFFIITYKSLSNVW